VVAGIRTPQDITEHARKESGSDKASMEVAMPDAFKELTRIYTQRKALPRHAGHGIHGGAGQAVDAADPQRQAHREGALRIAVDLANEGLITKKDAITRIDPASLDQLLHPTIDPVAKRDVIATGLPARRARQRAKSCSRRTKPQSFRPMAARSFWCVSKPRRKTFTACTPRKAFSPRAAA
jgi:pyruvate,orthophosphate dikinase